MFKKKTAPSSLRARPPPKVSTTNDEDDTEDTHVFSTLTIGGAKKKQNAIQSTASIRANRAKIIPHEVIDIDIDEPESIPTETQEPKKPQGKSLTDLYYTPHSSDEEVEIVAKKHIKNISSVPEDDYIEDKSRYVGINQNTYTKQPDYIALEQTNQSKPNQNDYMLNYQDQIYSETFYTSSRTKKDMIQKQIDLTEREEHNIDEEDDDDEMDSWVAQKMRAGGGKDIAANHLTAQRATRKKLKIPPTTIKIPQLDQYMKKLSTQLDKLEIEQSATVQDLEIEKKNSSHKRDQIKLHSTDVEHDGREAAFFQELGQWITEYAFFMEEKVRSLRLYHFESDLASRCPLLKSLSLNAMKIYALQPSLIVKANLYIWLMPSIRIYMIQQTTSRTLLHLSRRRGLGLHPPRNLPGSLLLLIPLHSLMIPIFCFQKYRVSSACLIAGGKNHYNHTKQHTGLFR